MCKSNRGGASTTRVLVLPKLINMNILKTLYSSTTPSSDFPVLILVCSVLVHALKSNVKNIFHIISHVGLSEWSHMSCGSSSIIAQSLRTLQHVQQNGPKLKISNNNKCMLYHLYFIIVKKKSAVTKTTPSPEDNYILIEIPWQVLILPMKG